jgi:hypothetical protein
VQDEGMRENVFIVMPAYNAGATIEQVFAKKVA